MLKLSLFMIFFIPSILWAQSVSEVLNNQVMGIKKKMGAGTALMMATNAQKNGARVEAFYIQSITRMFKDERKVFKELKNLIKDFEDHLGQVGKWAELALDPRLVPMKSSLYQKNYDAEMKKFADFLQSSRFILKLTNYNQEISRLGISEEETRRLVLSGIGNEIDTIMKKKYDLTYGETGLHELRRNLRWPLIQLDVFKEMFTYRKTSCPATTLFKTGVISRYFVLKVNPTSRHLVDYCAYTQLVGAVDYIGIVKDELERMGVLEERLAPDTIQMATTMLQDLRRNILPNLL